MAKKLRAMVVFGTRPEAIKMAPLVLELQRHQDVETQVCVTAQHREMLDQVLELFGIIPDFDLNIMQAGQTLTDITVRAIQGLEDVFQRARPNLVFVHGDTTTTFAGALAAFYGKIPVAHVEAGLRTWQKYAPYPEELNRKLTGALTDMHFAPTAKARQNLLAENVPDETIFVTGNTVIDALKTTVRDGYRFKREELNRLPAGKRLLLVEAHRRENLGEPLHAICRGLRTVVQRHQDVHMVFPVHKNPAVRETVNRYLAGLERVSLIEPLDVADFHNLMQRSFLILTDSGGIQEEAPSLGRPVLVLREVTERPEAVEAGTVALVGADEERLAVNASRLLDDREAYDKMANAINPYGDGRASARIVAAVRRHFGRDVERPADFMPGLPPWG
ncbi:MAG: UDP-N-acetylglucosamine 2-epimerase (non-hydrolyzing) [Bacillota bacterium]|nr:UDP-N-acetylglucosamine 2-epimerase (non-hydrolyzing) [Bacillota bacterium]MDW7684377.1 UDP-N-acetylglucosamine 2-epimerase (non-hydrolyzing) [Bacillota bacterium]